MRAQFVRGQDPKDAMEIGNKFARIERQILSTIQKLIEEYDLNPSTIRMSEDSKKDKSMLTYEFDGKSNPGYYGGKKFKYTYYISYWFLQDTFLPGVYENQTYWSDQGEEKTLSGTIKFLKELLDKNESTVY